MPESDTIPAERARFLAATPCADWAIAPLAADASARRYDRLTGPDGATAILMDAGPEAAATVPPFLRIGAHLRGLGLCAPEVLAQDPQGRFLLLEDLGPTDVAGWLRRHPQDEAALYTAAIDVLSRIGSAPPPDGLAHLTPDVGAQMLAPFFEWFAPADTRPRIEAMLQDALARHAGAPDTLSLRDFHAENLIWRPDRTGTDRVGLLDFQDAFVAPQVYDLVSLLRDARRDVSEGTRRMALDRYATASSQSPAEVEAAAAVLGVQRNLRILGIFARLARRDGKTGYRALMPRVTRHLQADLAHPALAALAPLVSPLLGRATA